MTTTTASPLTQTDASTWLIDAAHTTVEFQVKHMMFSTVKGRFSGVKGSIVDVADDPTLSSVDVEIDALSLGTGDPQRDGHLKSADFVSASRCSPANWCEFVAVGAAPSGLPYAV
jgi:polyisoprenoid-binding protein YceI